jgi:ribose transport system ATP-binding protein
MRTLTLSGLDKSYGSARVLQGVDLALRAGEVHALMGENGAGKSTLIKVLAGIVHADRMEITVDEEARRLSGPADAAALGLRFVHQELNIVPSLSVAENILLSRSTPRRFGIAVDWRAMHARAAEALARFGAPISIRPPGPGACRPGDRMLTVLAGLLASDDTAPSVFVMDEPTAALTHAEADRLFAVIADLKARGAAILYVSHRLAEVVEIADRVTVLRDGAVALSCPMAETSKDGIIAAMTGQDVADAYPAPARRHAPGQEVVLEVGQPLGRAGARCGFSALRRGRDPRDRGVGRRGAVGDPARASRRSATGSRAHPLGGEPAPRSAAEGWACGIAYVPRERRREGLMLGRGITPNVVLPHLARLSRWGLWSRGGAERRRRRRRATRCA